jgi:hypothetical protein
MREIREVIDCMGAPKWRAQQGIGIFPEFSFGMLLFGLTPSRYRAANDAKRAKLIKGKRDGSDRAIIMSIIFAHNSSLEIKEEFCRWQTC